MTPLASDAPRPPLGVRHALLDAVLPGLAVAAVGVAPWAVTATLNARIRPDLPWAAGATLAWLALLGLWLNGYGPPRSSSERRRRSLRLGWTARARSEARTASGADGAAGHGRTAEVVGIVLALAAMTVVWILISQGQRITDLSPYPTPAYRISVLVMGALVSGVVEEMAFRGYMQHRLEERYGVETAIAVTGAAFVLIHVTHGVVPMLVMAPGYFLAAVLYGVLAWRTGSILPGMALHATGDFLHTVFALLGGDLGMLTR